MMRRAQKLSGFTLIELTIVLGIVGLMIGGMWRMMSGNNAQMRDQVTAVQHKQLIDIIYAYLLTDEGQQYMASIPANGSRFIPLPGPATPAGSGGCYAALGPAGVITTHEGLCDALPVNFSTATTNPYGQTFNVGIRKDDRPAGTRPNSFSFMILAAGGEVISDTSGGRISSAIGGDGGFIYGDNAAVAVGAYGTWRVGDGPTGNIFNSYNVIGAAAGHVASVTRYSPSHSFSFNWLSRNPIPGDGAGTQNTMMANLIMNGGTEISLGSAASIVGTPAANTVDMGTFIDLKSNHLADSAPLINLSAKDGCVAAGAACSNFAINIAQGDIELNYGVMHSLTFAYATSDIRLKKDIKHLDGALDNIMKLNPVSFTYTQTNKPSMGVIAQELEKIYPQLVLTGGKDGMKSVAYEGLIAPLVGAVQELKKANDDLLAKQQEMQKEIDALKQAK